ncbi:hypothetical protein CN918_32060 [Priestia megaterium]|nr:hypothetical protein CN918_32060 [Priestia megaterium]
MIELQEKEIKKLLAEQQSLTELKRDVTLLVEQLRADQDLIKQTVAKMQTWKSGNASDAFKADMQEYFETFSDKVNKLEATLSSISSQIFEIRLQISNLQNIGPKF